MSFHRTHLNTNTKTFEYNAYTYKVGKLQTTNLSSGNGEIVVENPLNVGMNALKLRTINDLEGNICATAIDGKLLFNGSSSTKGYVNVVLETEESLSVGQPYQVGDLDMGWSKLEDDGDNWKNDQDGFYYLCDKDCKLNVSQYYQTNSSNKALVLEVQIVDNSGNDVGYFTCANLSSGYSHSGHIVINVKEGYKVYLNIRPNTNATLARAFLISNGDAFNKYRGHFQITEL